MNVNTSTDVLTSLGLNGQQQQKLQVSPTTRMDAYVLKFCSLIADCGTPWQWEESEQPGINMVANACPLSQVKETRIIYEDYTSDYTGFFLFEILEEAK